MQPSPFYRDLAIAFSEIEAIEGYNRNLGVGTAVKPQSCDPVFHSLCFVALHKELFQRKPLLQGDHISCFASGCHSTLQYWSEIQVYPLDHLIKIDKGLVILSNKAVTLMKKYSVTKETEKKSKTERKISPFVKMMPLEHYYDQIRASFQRLYSLPAPLYIFSLGTGGGL